MTGVSARSLLDGVDVRAVRASAAGLPGPFGTVAACLRVAGLVQHDTRDPGWPDRDRLVVGDASAAHAVRAAWGGRSPAEPAGAAAGTALAVAAGAALASGLDGGIYRVWCLLGDAAVEDGTTWEAARAAVAGGCGVLLVAACGPAAATTGDLLALAGWAVETVQPDDPLSVLAAVDRGRSRHGTPTALVGGR